MEDKKEGFIFLKDVKGLQVLLIFCMVSNFLVSPVFAVVSHSLFEKLLAFPDSNLVYFRQAGLR
jgi:hypothetical protein